MAKDVHYIDPSRHSDHSDYDPKAAADYVKNLKPVKEQKRRSKRNKIILASVLLVVAVGSAGYWLFLKPNPHEQKAPQTTQSPQIEDQPQVVESTKYSSTDLSLSFDYPKNWKIDDSTKGLIRVESPATKLADTSGNQADAKVVVTFLSTGSEVPAFEGRTSATAVMDSEKITYDSPSQSQRQQTYLSFAGFGSGRLDAVFITGDSGYQKDQFIPESDVKKIDPIVSVQAYTCADTGCAGQNAAPYAVAVNEWSANRMFQAALAILKSLRVE